MGVARAARPPHGLTLRIPPPERRSKSRSHEGGASTTNEEQDHADHHGNTGGGEDAADFAITQDSELEPWLAAGKALSGAASI